VLYNVGTILGGKKMQFDFYGWKPIVVSKVGEEGKVALQRKVPVWEQKYVNHCKVVQLLEDLEARGKIPKAS
jgi:hypothetical protein